MLIRLSFGGNGPGVYRRNVNLFPGWISPVLSPAIFGIVRNSTPWAVVFALYADDKMAEAASVMRTAGIGDFAEFAAVARVVDAEAQAGQFSLITRLTDWMEVELSPSTEMEPYQLAGAADLIENSFRAFGMAKVPPVLLTVLPPEVTLPSFLELTGYVTTKQPYAKYCVPHAIAHNADRLANSLPLLACSHAAGVLSDENANQWLLCAAQALDGPELLEERKGFCSGAKPWLEPSELDARLMGLRVAEDSSSILIAHEQAVLVGRHLLQIGGSASLVRCLSQLAPKDLWGQLRGNFSSNPVKDACKRVYGYAPEYLFEHALASTCGR